jgi:hypothetical protein
MRTIAIHGEGSNGCSATATARPLACTPSRLGFRPKTMAAINAYEPQASRFQAQLQTGTGTLHITAISTVAITAVIFSLADRLMASSECEANFSAPLLYAAFHGYAVTEITLRRRRLLIAARACRSCLQAGSSVAGLALPPPPQASPALPARDRAAAREDNDRLQ